MNAKSLTPTDSGLEVKPDPRISTELCHSLRLISLGLASVVALLSFVSIAGWFIRRDTFLITCGEAIELLLWCIAFFCFTRSKLQPLKVSAFIAVGLISITAILNIAYFMFDIDTGLTKPLLTLGEAPLNFPGPLLADLSLSLLTLAIATVLMFFKSPRFPSIHKTVAIVLLVPNLLIVGSSIAGLHSICTFLGCEKPNLFASSALILAGLAIVFAYPDEGITAQFTYNTASGRLIRSIFLSLTPCIPIFALLTLGQSRGYYDQSISLGMMVLSIVGLFILGITLGAQKVEAIEEEKKVALQLLQDSLNSFAPEADTTFKMVCLECAKEFEDSSLMFCPDDGSELAKLADKLKIGSVFSDRYEIVSFIGAGGCSLIYEAKHMLMSKRVALKLLRSNFSTEAKYVQRFQRESKATSQLEHTNIVGVHDFGISLAGQPYIVMDFLQGLSLCDYIDRAGAMPWRQAVPIFASICEGLSYAHTKGVLHRDLKPANIMLVSENNEQPSVVKIVDFGLAKTADMTDVKLTQTGELIGSPTYMSPEQCRAEPVDTRTDIYSLGALMYHCLSGRPAVETGNVYEAFQLQISEPPARFSNHLRLPAWLSNMVYKALEKVPDMRYQSVDEMLTELRAGMINTPDVEFIQYHNT
jgi:tRNA A-37 threonylcarbamoyl transferase component Bud32